MKTHKGFRHHARFAVRWPVTYWNEGVLFGQGTVQFLVGSRGATC